MKPYNSDRLFQTFNGLLLLAASMSMVAPIVHLIAVSLSEPAYANAGLVTLWPRGFQWTAYEEIMKIEKLWRSFAVTIYVCAVGTVVYLAFTTSLGYALSRPMMPYRRLVLKGILVTLVFTSPLIPNYMLIRNIGLENTLWALMVPGAVSAFSVIIMKTFLQNLSAELFDAAKIDGSSEYSIYARIALPLSKPVIATLSLFHVVGLWNSYFAAIIFIRDQAKFPLQVVLRSLIVNDQVSNEVIRNTGVMQLPATPEQLKAGIIIVATLPILCVYPFIQKHFVKGAMLGSLKE